MSSFQSGVSRTSREIFAGNRRTPDAEGQELGLHIGLVMDDYDDQHAGRLWVYIPNFSTVATGEQSIPYGPVARGRTIGADGSSRIDQEHRNAWILVAPMFPAYGSDEFRYGSDSAGRRNARDGQTNSYGWTYQPRIGDRVAVMFAYGDPHQGYWFACLPKVNQNFMVPGSAAATEASEGLLLPAHEKSVKAVNEPRVASQAFADNLIEAGLQRDPMRGAGASSAMRESPSYVFGFKSAGWDYDIEKDLPIGGGNTQLFRSNSRYQTIHAMGHQIVLDDHPDHQMVRVRTSNGNQVLLNDVDGYIYLNTPKGNAWFEMSDTGDVNGFCSGSFSWHCEKDFNMQVDGNWNVQVNKNWNVAVGKNTTMTLTEAVTVFSGMNGAQLTWDQRGPAKYIITGQTDLHVKNNMNATIQNNFKLTAHDNIELISDNTFGLKAGEEINTTSGGATNILAGSTLFAHAGSTLSLIGGGTTHLDGSAILIGMGGPTAKDAGIASPAEPQTAPTPMLAKTWGPTPKEGVAEMIPYVGAIVPQHEPWPGHPSTKSIPKGSVQYNTTFVKTIRPGAITPNASQPVDYVDENGVVQRAKPYKTNNPGEQPTYTPDPNAYDGSMNPASKMSLSEEGKNFIKAQEGWSSVPYKDANGWSVGYGHFINEGDVIGGKTITASDMALIRQGKGAEVINIDKDEGNRLFDSDLPKYQSAVQKNITAPMTQGQFDAMTSLSYNVGPDWIRKSTMTKKFNAGDVPGAITEFQGFNKSEGQVHPGLVKRRNEEINQLFNAGIKPPSA